MNTKYFVLICVCLTDFQAYCLTLTAQRAGMRLPTARGEVALSYDNLDTVYIIGGSSGSQSYRDILKYTFSADILRFVGQLPEEVTLPFSGNNGEGHHYVMDGEKGIYRFQDGVEHIVDMVGSLPQGADVLYLNLQQRAHEDILYMVPYGITNKPRLYEFNMTQSRVTREVAMDSLEGYDQVSLDGAVYVEEGNYIFVFAKFEDTSNGGVPSRHDVALKYLIDEDKVEFVQLPFFEEWQATVHPFYENDNVYLFGSYGSTLGIHRVDINRQTTEYVEIIGIIQEAQFLLTTTLYVPALKRLYMFGGFANDGAKHEIWYVDVSPLTETPTTTTTTTIPTSTIKPCGHVEWSCPPFVDGNYGDPQDCSGFVACVAGRPYCHNCPSGLHYHIENDQCDFPHNVDCGSRPIP